MNDRVITRELLADWILNDGLEHLLREGYLTPGEVDKSDAELLMLVTQAWGLWQAYEGVADRIHGLVEQ